MSAQKSLSLAIVSSVILLSTGIASAGNIEVNTGEARVSINDRAITVQSAPATRTPPSILERLRIWRSNRSPVPAAVNTSSTGKCKTSSSSHQSTRTSSSDRGVVQTNSSSSSTVCN